MTEYLGLTSALGAGLLFGTLFFGGLWWTIRKGLSSARPALWFLGSLLIRTGLTLIGFYFVGGSDVSRWLACLIGFGSARVAAARFVRVGRLASVKAGEVVEHAS